MLLNAESSMHYTCSITSQKIAHVGRQATENVGLNTRRVPEVYQSLVLKTWPFTEPLSARPGLFRNAEVQASPLADWIKTFKLTQPRGDGGHSQESPGQPWAWVRPCCSSVSAGEGLWLLSHWDLASTEVGRGKQQSAVHDYNHC